MATFPGGVPALTNPLAGDPTTAPNHADQHSDANDEIEAIATELGTDPAGGSATVKDRFGVIEATSWVTTARIATGAVTGNEIVDGAISTVKIGDDQVTDAKIGAPSTGSLSSGNLQYARMGNLVTVWTLFSVPGSGLTLPAGFRPGQALNVNAGCISASQPGFLNIKTTGVIEVRDNAGTITPGYFSVTFTTP